MSEGKLKGCRTRHWAGKNWVLRLDRDGGFALGLSLLTWKTGNSRTWNAYADFGPWNLYFSVWS